MLCNRHKAFDREAFSTEYLPLDDYFQHIAFLPGNADHIQKVLQHTVWYESRKSALRLTSSTELEGPIILPNS
jgi:hypothetical protein